MIRPRLSADSPAAARSRSSVWPCRPAEYITVSAGMRFPLASAAIAPSGRRSTADTVSPNRNVTARSRRWYLSASTTSRSQNSSIRSRCSTTVTLVPSAANIEAYSMPITPAPATTIDRGTRSRCRMPSESMIVRSSNSTLAGRAGLVPVAMMIFSALDLAAAAGAVGDLDVGRAGEARRPGQDGHPVAGELAAHDVVLPADDVMRAGGQVADRDLVLDPVALPVHLALVEPGQVEDGLAQRLGRNGAGVEAHAAEHVRPLDDRHPAVELGSRDRRLLAAGARADHQHVEVVHIVQCDEIRRTCGRPHSRRALS